MAGSLLTTRLDSDGGLKEKEPVVTLRRHLGSAIVFHHSLAAAPGKGLLGVFPRSQLDYWGWGKGPGLGSDSDEFRYVLLGGTVLVPSGLPRWVTGRSVDEG